MHNVPTYAYDAVLPGLALERAKAVRDLLKAELQDFTYSYRGGSRALGLPNGDPPSISSEYVSDDEEHFTTFRERIDMPNRGRSPLHADSPSTSFTPRAPGRGPLRGIRQDLRLPAGISITRTNPRNDRRT